MLPRTFLFLVSLNVEPRACGLRFEGFVGIFKKDPGNEVVSLKCMCNISSNLPSFPRLFGSSGTGLHDEKVFGDRQNTLWEREFIWWVIYSQHTRRPATQYFSHILFYNHHSLSFERNGNTARLFEKFYTGNKII